VPDHIYEASLSKTFSAASGAICSITSGTLGAGIRLPEIREIGVFTNTAVAATVGVGRPAAAGTGASTTETVQALNVNDPAGHTVAATAWSGAPTIPTNFMRQFGVQGSVGAGIIWVWGPGEFIMGSADQVVVWCSTSTSNQFYFYVKVAE
jgi:hypothetical protein